MHHDLNALMAQAQKELNQQICLMFSGIFSAVGRAAGALGHRLATVVGQRHAGT